VVFLAYPNNPTANLFDAGAIVEIIRAAPGLVVVDEAYAPFTDASFMPRIGEFPNLVVMRTVSKMGLAGLRLGLLAGPAAWLDEFDKVRLPYNVNVLTQVSAEFALRHRAVFDEQTASIRAERARVAAGIAGLDGVTVYPSEANFLLVRTPAGQARAWFEGLRERGVLIKNLDGAHPLLTDCLRPTVGTPAENAALLAALADVAASGR
jgi:histidinol-phosphate aminotransferase